jgi:hypothetical protein
MVGDIAPVATSAQVTPNSGGAVPVMPEGQKSHWATMAGRSAKKERVAVIFMVE